MIYNLITKREINQIIEKTKGKKAKEACNYNNYNNIKSHLSIKKKLIWFLHSTVRIEKPRGLY